MNTIFKTITVDEAIPEWCAHDLVAILHSVNKGYLSRLDTIRKALECTDHEEFKDIFFSDHSIDHTLPVNHLTFIAVDLSKMLASKPVSLTSPFAIRPDNDFSTCKDTAKNLAVFLQACVDHNAAIIHSLVNTDNSEE